jgi:diguanylate cyclase (GGDEF)-like protein
MKLIAVTSPATDAGKTFIAAGIAEAATYHNLKTLFMDFDNPVGDALRVFGVSSHNLYPTLGDWASYPDPWGGCLKSKAGTYLLPRPNMLDEEIDAEGLLKSVEDFDLVIADLGTDYRQEYWRLVVNQADLALLVSDCDEKALVRIRQFLNSKPANKEWTLIINSRERKGYYTESQIERELSGEVQQIISLPYFPEAEQRSPKTFPPESVHLARVLNLLFGGISVEENLFNKIKIPRLSFRRKTEKEEPLKPTKEARKKITGKSGHIRNNQFIEVPQEKIQEGVDDSNGIIIPAAWGVKFIKSFRRDYPLIPIFVLGGGAEHLKAGADRCIKKITPQIINEEIALSERIKLLWAKVESDPLTGLYTRDFLSAWMKDREQREKPYTAVMLDIDKFKSVNDTYGHQTGDMVLSLLGSFLKSSLRFGDIVARYGGEEFVMCLPDTGIQDGYKLIDRLRLKWGERRITLEDSREISCTFSAGIAEWPNSWKVLEEADKRLYEAKNKGRNQVCISSGPRILTLGLTLNDNRVQATFDPNEAVAAISNATNAKHAPAGMPLYIVLSGQIGDWVAKQNNPDAVFCNSVTEAVNLILKPKITVLPGARGNDKGMTIPHHGALYIVSPSRPALAGEIAAALCEETPNCALVCASPESMGAVSLGIPTKTLVTSDWRFPGAEAPLDWNGIKVWPVDPYKYADTRSDPKSVVDQIKSHFSLVIIDCASSLDLCARVARNEGILVLTREGDASDQITQQWLKTYGGINVAVVNPTEMPLLKEVENGFVLSRTSSLVQNF